MAAFCSSRLKTSKEMADQTKEEDMLKGRSLASAPSTTGASWLASDSSRYYQAGGGGSATILVSGYRDLHHIHSSSASSGGGNNNNNGTNGNTRANHIFSSYNQPFSDNKASYLMGSGEVGRGSWGGGGGAAPVGDMGGALTWPPRSYHCTFCRREFRSAQALGGHMNVHRRDRARLRHSSPSDMSPPPLPTTPASDHHHFAPLFASKTTTPVLSSCSSSSPTATCTTIATTPGIQLQHLLRSHSAASSSPPHTLHLLSAPINSKTSNYDSAYSASNNSTANNSYSRAAAALVCSNNTEAAGASQSGLSLRGGPEMRQLLTRSVKKPCTGVAMQGMNISAGYKSKELEGEFEEGEEEGEEYGEKVVVGRLMGAAWREGEAVDLELRLGGAASSSSSYAEALQLLP